MFDSKNIYLTNALPVFSKTETSYLFGQSPELVNMYHTLYYIYYRIYIIGVHGIAH